MQYTKSNTLSPIIFVPLLSLIFIRPFFSGLAYPIFETYYQYCIMFLAVITIFIYLNNKCRGTIYRARTDMPYAPIQSNLLPILFLLFAYIISTTTSINTQNSIRETVKFISFISIFFIVSQCPEKQKRILVKIILIGAVIISIYSIYQYFWGYQNTLDYLKKTQDSILLSSSYARDILIAKRAIGTFPSPNIFGGYLLIVFFLSIYQRWFVASFLILSAIILTKSVGVWLSLTIGLTAFFFISYNSIKKRKIILISSAIVILLSICFIIINRWDRFMDLQNPQNSITQRLNYWRTAIAIIKDHPLLGVGPGNFQEVFLKYKVGFSTDTRYAHNIFLHIWAETGLLGMIAIFSIIIALLRNFMAIQHYKNGDENLSFPCKRESKSIWIPAFAGMTKKPEMTFWEAKLISLSIWTFFIHNLIDNTFFIPEVGMFLWILLGLTPSLHELPHRNNQ